MPRPPTPLRAGWVTQLELVDIWNRESPEKRKRLLALFEIWDAQPSETRTRLAEQLGVSRRQLCRWVAAFNRGGVKELLYPRRRRPGRKRKISSEEFNTKVLALITENGITKSTWSYAEIQRQLAAQHQIYVSAGTLRRYLRQSGYSPAPRQSKAPYQAPWTLPWPRQYGANLADYLANSGQKI